MVLATSWPQEIEFLFRTGRGSLLIALSVSEKDRLVKLCGQCREDFEVRDAFLGKMVRTIVVQLIILLARRPELRSRPDKEPEPYANGIFRKFFLLLEENFRREHTVGFYAREMRRSPKTLTNLFGIYKYPSPSKLIQLRIIREVKRYVYYTDLSAKEIASELGFVSAAHFSRFFKLRAGVTFTTFRNPGPQ